MTQDSCTIYEKEKGDKITNIFISFIDFTLRVEFFKKDGANTYNGYIFNKNLNLIGVTNSFMEPEEVLEFSNKMKEIKIPINKLPKFIVELYNKQKNSTLIYTDDEEPIISKQKNICFTN